MDRRLKQCPFCGGDGALEKSPTLSGISPSVEGMSGGELSETGEYRYFVYCTVCGNFCKRSGYTGKATKSFNTVEQAVEAWNRRADNHTN